MLNDFNPKNPPKFNPIIPTGVPADDDDPMDGFGNTDPRNYLINYNEKFKNENPMLFRDDIIHQILSCLIGKFKPNALVKGAAGTGKTKIVEDIARRIANNDALIPPQLKDYTIWELPLSNIVAGSALVGELERKAKSIIEFASDPDNKIILFIDEIHVLVGESQTYDKIAQIMKPALARGNMKVIGATTLQESQNLMKDPAFNRRFTGIIVNELSKDQTETILNNMSQSMFVHYDKKIALTPAVIHDIVVISDEFKSMSTHRPDNAITLLDRAMADAFIERKVLEEEAHRNNDKAMLQALKSSPTIVLSKSQMRKTAMKLITGNEKKNDIEISKIRTALNPIKGQNEVIDYIIDTIKRDNLRIYPRQKPLTMLFAGNSGVGKSEIAKIIARELTGSKPIILNMTEFHSPASINRIIGAPAGYVGSDSKSELPFDILESNPYKVILLDEFEKSDKAVQRLFMSAFDEGYIKTAKGKIVDFSKAIVFATTNAGHTTKNHESIGFTPNTRKTSVSDLSEFFDIELLNRFTKILNFNPITETLFEEILEDVYETDVKRIKSEHTSYSFLSNTLSDDDKKVLIKENFKREFGARPIKKAVQNYIENKIIDNIYASANTDNDVLVPDDDYED